MSRRFGRNQKRRMRARIVELEKGFLALEKQLVEEIAHSIRCRQIVDETADILGRHFMTLEPRTGIISKLNQIAEDFKIIAGGPEPQETEVYVSRIPDKESYLEYALPLLRGSYLANELQSHQHIRFSYHGQQVAYGIRKESLAMMDKDYAIQMIAGEMAAYLVNTKLFGGEL